MMAQVSKFGHLLLLPKPSNSNIQLRSLVTVLASSSSPKRHRSIPPFRRKSTTPKPMEQVKESSFNKRRAEGRDKNDISNKNLQLKVRKLNPINTISYVQILGTGMDTQDTSPSVLLFFDNQRFIFNAGEGLQRFCTEHKIKLSKIDHIFLSRVCSETAGGLPGLLLTLAGMGEEGMSVNIWGPSDLKYLVDAMRSFIPNAAMVHTKSFGPIFNADGPTVPCQSKLLDPIILIDDEVVKISAIILQPNCIEGHVLTPSESSPQERMDCSPETLLSPNGKKLPAAKPGDMSVVYVCELPEIKGKFDPLKAMALGLKPGPKYRALQLGNSVKSDHQDIMVHPSDVLGPSVPGPIVLLVDCPTESHLKALLSVQSLGSYCGHTDNLLEAGKSVTCVIHLTPASVVSCSNYQKWMKKFGSAQHIMAGHEKKNVEIPILKASARIATRLNYLCPQFFPAPGFWSLPNHHSSKFGSLASSEGSLSELSEVISAENLLKFTLRPYAHLGFDRSCIPTRSASSEIIDELLSEIPEVLEAVKDVSKLWQEYSQEKEDLTPVVDHEMMIEEPSVRANDIPACLENIRRDDLEMVLLGTGSSQPSKYRNVSSIYINLFSKGGLLLDCGEGTLGQLKRRYGVTGADDAVRTLKCIWISHIHADHHTGLARILALRRDLLRGVPHEPVLVVGPRQLKRYLDAYQRLEDLDMLFLDCKHTTETSLKAFEDDFKRNSVNSHNVSGNNGDLIASKVDSTLFARGSHMQSYFKRPGSPVDKGVVSPIIKKFKEIIQEAGLKALISFPVVHCPQAFGVVLKAEERTNSVGKVIPGWKIVYSGDTRPCPELIEASRDATVLIHEATFEDAMVEEAIARNHSTTNEAIEMDSEFSQQELYAWKPILTPGWVISTFSVIGVIFIPIGLASLFSSERVEEAVWRYDESCLPPSHAKNAMAYIQSDTTNKTCITKWTVEHKMEAPIFIYYQLENFYQNHRRYVKSRNDQQLRSKGGEGDTKNCYPEDKTKDNKNIVPCGLIAWSMFNDTYRFSTKNKDLTVNKKNIAWGSDQRSRFGSDVYPKNFQTGDLIGGAKLNESIPLNEQEDLIVWMRTAALPTFRKLYGKIEVDLEMNDEIEIVIENNYNTYEFGGQKKLVLSTATLMGGKNPFVGTAYLFLGGLSLFSAIAFILLYVIKPRPLGDPSYLSWNKNPGNLKWQS